MPEVILRIPVAGVEDRSAGEGVKPWISVGCPATHGGSPGRGFRVPRYIDITLPETNMTFSHLKMDGCNTFSFPFGVSAYFQGRTVSFREGMDHIYTCIVV